MVQEVPSFFSMTSCYLFIKVRVLSIVILDAASYSNVSIVQGNPENSITNTSLAPAPVSKALTAASRPDIPVPSLFAAVKLTLCNHRRRFIELSRNDL